MIEAPVPPPPGSGRGARRPAIGPLLVLVGGALAVAGSVLPWVTYVVPGTTVRLEGVDGWEGTAVLVAGAAAAVAGAWGLRARSGGVHQAVAVVGLVAGLTALFPGAWTALSVEDRFVEAYGATMSASLGLDPSEAASIVVRALAEGQVRIVLGEGLFVFLAGSALAWVGGMVTAVGVTRPVRPFPPGDLHAPASPPPPPWSAPPAPPEPIASWFEPPSRPDPASGGSGAAGG